MYQLKQVCLLQNSKARQNPQGVGNSEQNLFGPRGTPSYVYVPVFSLTSLGRELCQPLAHTHHPWGVPEAVPIPAGAAASDAAPSQLLMRAIPWHHTGMTAWASATAFAPAAG